MWKTLYETMQTELVNVVTNITTGMSSAVSGPLGIAMTIYIIMYGIAILRGAINELFIDFAIRGLKLIAIWTVAATAGGYSQWAGNFIVVELPNLVNELVGANGQSVADQIMLKGDEVRNQFTQDISQYGWSEIANILITGLIMFMVLIQMSVVAAIIWAVSLWAYVALTLVAAVGPLFVAFALFDFSRGWFFAWLGQILNFFLLSLLVQVLGMIAFGLYNSVLAKTGFTAIVVTGLNLILASIALCFLFFLLPSIAAALSSGAQASTGAVQRAVERRLTGGGKGGGGGGSKGGSASKS